MTPTPEQARAAMEHISAELAVAKHVESRSASIRVEHLATLLTLLEASARALGRLCDVISDSEGHGDEASDSDCPICVAHDEARTIHALIAPKGEG